MQEQQQRLEGLRKRLLSIDAKESNFLKVELLFYEALEAARMTGDDPDSNKLLDALKQLQAGIYQDTKKLYKKSSQREQVIRRFMTQLKSIITTAIKNASLSSTKRHSSTS